MRRSFAVTLFLSLLLTVAPAAADSITHTVVAGDSLSTIADRFGVSVSALEARNHLTDASVLQLGQQIVVPVHVHHPAPAALPSQSLYPSLQMSVALHAVHAGASRSHSSSQSTARIAASRALWAATHVGSVPPDFPGIEPFELAQRVLVLDSQITRTALRYLGVPYMWGGTSFNGVDCSGFVQSVFAKNGISLPRMADEQFSVGHRIAAKVLMPGDLVFFETYTSGASHVGIYLGGGKFIHASMRGVVIDALSMDYYASRYIGARRFVQ
jgi:peptidoglycan endopeptidase LytE